MKIGQSGVSGLLGFFDALNKGKQESQERRSKTMEMGLGFAKENRELERQNINDERAKKAFEEQQKLTKLQTEGQQFNLDQSKRQPYITAVQARDAKKATLATLRAQVPTLIEQLGKTRQPAAIQGINAKLAEITRQINGTSSDWARQVKGYGLTPEQEADLLNLEADDQPAPAPTTSPIGAPAQSVQAEQPITGPAVTGFSPLSSKPEFGGTSQGFGSAPVGMGGASSGFGSLPTPQAGSLPPQYQSTDLHPAIYQMLQQGGATVQPSPVDALLARLGLTKPEAGSAPMSAEEQEKILKDFEALGLGGQVSGTDLPDPQFDFKGLLKPESIPTNIDLGKAVTRLLPQIQSSVRRLAELNNVTVSDVQEVLFGKDTTKWAVGSDGKDQVPADMTAIKSGMARYLSPKPEVVAKWADQLVKVDDRKYEGIKLAAQQAFEAAQNNKNRINAREVARITADATKAGQDANTARAYAGMNADLIERADRQYFATAETAINGLATDPASTLVNLGVVDRVTKLGVDVDIAKVMAETLIEALGVERNKFSPTKNDYAVSPMTFQNRLNNATINAKIASVDAGIKAIDAKVPPANTGQGGMSANQDTELREQLVTQKRRLEALRKTITGGSGAQNNSPKTIPK